MTEEEILRETVERKFIESMKRWKPTFADWEDLEIKKQLHKLEQL